MKLNIRVKWILSYDFATRWCNGQPRAMVPIDRPAPVAPLAGPAGRSGAASSAQGHYVQFSHPSDRLTQTVSVLKQSAWEKET